MAQHSRAGKSVELAAALSQPGNENLVNFVPAVAYHFCLNLPAAFTQPGALTFADVCINWQFSGHSVKD